MECAFELSHGGRSQRELARQRQPAGGRHHGCMNAISDGDLEIAIVILQFTDLDRGLALAANADQSNFGADRDDRTLDGLTFLDALRFLRSLEHRREVFLGLAHGTLLIIDSSEASPQTAERTCGRAGLRRSA